MPARKTGEEMNFTYVECLLYVLHHLAHKAPNATNSLCGYKIVTGQPSDRLGEDFSEFNKEFTERLTSVEDLTKATMKKLTQGMSEHSKAMSTAKTDEEKSIVVRTLSSHSFCIHFISSFFAGLILPKLLSENEEAEYNNWTQDLQ
jgi:hypothetical protein